MTLDNVFELLPAYQRMYKLTREGFQMKDFVQAADKSMSWLHTLYRLKLLLNNGFYNLFRTIKPPKPSWIYTANDNLPITDLTKLI